MDVPQIILENVYHPLKLGWDFCVYYLLAKNSLLSLCMTDKKHLKRLLISNNSVAGMAALVLLVLSSVSEKFNHCVHSSQISLCLIALIW